METQSSQPAPKSGGMNSMMIVGAVIVLAIIGYFVIRSTAQQPSQEASSTDSTTEDTTMEDMEGDDAMMTAEQGSEGSTTNDTPMETMDGDVRVISVEGGSFYYKPNTITVKKGETVRIEMKSVDMMHDFVIDELGVKSEIAQAGDTATVEFTADTVGEFEFYCSVGQHRANGMVGTLIVEE